MNLDTLDLPTEVDALVSFFDLTNFFGLANRQSDLEIYRMMSDYYEWVGDLVAESGGIIVQFAGDEALMLHGPEAAEAGVLGLLRLQEEGDAWLKARGLHSRNIIRAHYGSIVIAKAGTRSQKRLSVFGKTVNTAAKLPSTGVAISVQAFRQLSPEGRKAFKKHTQPITYIPLAQPHR